MHKTSLNRLSSKEKWGDLDLDPEELAALDEVDRFYRSIGGVSGYHKKVVSLLQSSEMKKVVCAPISPIDIRQGSWKYLEEAVISLPLMGELYPVGGLATRLDLKSYDARPLPASYLPFCGRPLIEGLLRDVEAKEELYYRIFGKRIVIPVAMMTSSPHIEQIVEENGYFGRPKESLFLFAQPLVPVISESGELMRRSEGGLQLEPGGHGAIWKAACDAGVFTWFEKWGREYLLVRQINNPIGGIDEAQLPFIGAGIVHEKAFGFAACERPPHVKEGMLVEKEGRIVNVEYTDVERCGLQEVHPSNTNILFANLKRLKPILAQGPLPGLMVNPKGSVRAARLESMMQNLSELLPKESCFVTYNHRLKTISSAKKKYERGKGLQDTPENAFYDWMLNGYALLSKCGYTMPPLPSRERYEQEGLPFALYYHPKLGPLFEIIAQKLRGGRIEVGSLLDLECADLLLEDVHLAGAVQIEGKGRCHLRDVSIVNRGGDFSQVGQLWQKEVPLLEKLSIHVGEGAELLGEALYFKGGLTVTVPNHERWVVRQNKDQSLVFLKEKIGPFQRVGGYSLERGHIRIYRDNRSHIPALLKK